MAERRATPKATVNPTIRDVAWAAGFLDGEGHFGTTTVNRNGCNTQQITARQNEREPLDQMARLFGGRVAYVSQRSNKLARAPGIWSWGVYGGRARGLMLTLYPLLTARRKLQVETALL